MKNINYYILEKLQKINSKNDHLNIDILSNKYIEQDDLIEYCFKALDNTNVYLADIRDEINQYKDDDALDRARNNDELTNYSKFENELANLLADDDNYSGFEGDICDNLFSNIRQFVDKLINILINKIHKK